MQLIYLPTHPLPGYGYARKALSGPSRGSELSRTDGQEIPMTLAWWAGVTMISHQLESQDGD